MVAKRTRVSQQEKEKMWQLYKSGYNFAAIAKKMRRGRDTVSRYVHEYEAAIQATSYILNQKNV